MSGRRARRCNRRRQWRWWWWWRVRSKIWDLSWSKSRPIFGMVKNCRRRNQSNRF